MTDAQTRVSYISEHFDSEDIPSGWTFEGDGTENWSIWQTQMAGGEQNEMKLYWKPSFEGTSRMVTPAINLTDIEEVTISFKGFLDNYQNQHKLGVATTSDDGATWNVGWQNTFSSNNQGQHSITQNIKTPDMGKENVKFCIFFEGTSGFINGWYFDDIEIFALDKLNLGVQTIEVPNIIGTDACEVSFIAKNTGTTDVTHFSASYQIDDNEVVTEEFQINVASLKEQKISFKDKFVSTPGFHTLTVSIFNINGEQDIENDNVMTKDINIALGKIQRTPMIEHFSSPTCAPCVAVNEGMLLLTEKYSGKYTYTKYPLDYPFDGDPYFTDECRIKKKYYNITGAPTIILDGNLYGNTFISNQDFESQYDVPAYIDIKGAFDVNLEDSLISVSIDILPLTDISQKKMFVSVNEKVTTGNVAYNGETQFRHIMMKMLPNAEGSDIDLTAGEIQHFDFSYNLNETYVEELEDLEVSVWIQDYYTQEIFNSHYMYGYTEHPYPAKNLQLTKADKNIEISWDKPETANPIGYNVYVNDKLVSEKTNYLSYSHEVNGSGLYVVNVVAVYENEKTSVGAVNNIMVESGEYIFENEIKFDIYPNPADNNIIINTEDNIKEINIFNIYGISVYSSHRTTESVDVSNLNSGVYFIKVSNDKGETVKPFIRMTSPK